MGFDQLTFSPTTNTLSTEVVVGSMELFGREVIPQFDTDPEHSTRGIDGPPPPRPRDGWGAAGGAERPREACRPKPRSPRAAA